MPDWGDVLKEIQGVTLQATQAAQGAMDLVRRKYLAELAAQTNRSIIAYYSGFLSKPDIPSEITDEDKNGFMMCVHMAMIAARGLISSSTLPVVISPQPNRW